jgi:hypothetical protein
MSHSMVEVLQEKGYKIVLDVGEGENREVEMNKEGFKAEIFDSYWLLFDHEDSFNDDLRSEPEHLYFDVPIEGPELDAAFAKLKPSLLPIWVPSTPQPFHDHYSVHPPSWNHCKNSFGGILDGVSQDEADALRCYFPNAWAYLESIPDTIYSHEEIWDENGDYRANNPIHFVLHMAIACWHQKPFLGETLVKWPTDCELRLFGE